LVRVWRNDPFVRLAMFSSKLIAEAEHLAWFARISQDEGQKWLLHADADGRPDGVVYFTEYQQVARHAVWGFYRAPDSAPGVGTLLGLEGLDHAFDVLGLHKLSAEVLASNSRSVAFHERLGFVREGVSRDGHLSESGYIDVLHYGLFAHEWRQHRPLVLAALSSHKAKIQAANTAAAQDAKAERYIVASCRPWHRAGFEQIKSELPGQWEWVATTAELDAALAQGLPRYVFFLHWNWLVPEAIWSRVECVCFHMTDVPYGQGGSPLQNLIAAGHSETRLTALRMVREMDAGPVYAKLPLSLAGRAEDIYIKAGELSLDLLRWIIRQQPEPVPQQGEPVIFKRRTPEQSRLPDSGVLSRLYDHIRMLDAPGYPPAFLPHGEFRFEFSQAQMQADGTLRAQAIIRHMPTSGENGS
jgi:UDP-4-amino-4,6-dideoxy-N-acetyl-beta-L-altrosamine N-acetyltransferase